MDEMKRSKSVLERKIARVSRELHLARALGSATEAMALEHEKRRLIAEKLDISAQISDSRRAAHAAR